MITTTYKVKGMTCGHCEQSVTNELTTIEGVTDVAVDLETGDVNVTSSAELDAAAVRAAIDEAGFELLS
jgi:copper chaperone CopZ